MSQSSKRYLFCFDFDLTITKEHLHHYTQSLMSSHLTRDRSCLKAIQVLSHHGVKHEERLWECIYQILLQGHGLAITSFTAFPELPLAFLSKGIRNLRKRTQSKEYDHYLHRPVVVYGPAPSRLLPAQKIAGSYYVNLSLDESYQNGKCQHMLQAQDILQTKGFEFDQLVLIDDDLNNIEKAIEAGFIGISVPHNDEDDYLSDIQRLVDELGQ